MGIKYKVYVSTSDNVMWTLKDCSKAFNIHCPDTDVIVLGYSTPPFDLPKNYSFISMGKDRGVNYWAEDLYNAFNKVDDEYFIWGLDDYEIQTAVDIDMINNYCPKYMNEKTNWFGLNEGPAKRSHELVKKYSDFEIIKLTQNATYRVTCQFNVWNKARLLHYLKMSANSTSNIGSHAAGTPWHFEVSCSQAAQNDGYDIYAFKNKIPMFYRGLNYTVQNESIQPKRKQINYD